MPPCMATPSSAAGTGRLLSLCHSLRPLLLRRDFNGVANVSQQILSSDEDAPTEPSELAFIIALYTLVVLGWAHVLGGREVVVIGESQKNEGIWACFDAAENACIELRQSSLGNVEALEMVEELRMAVVRERAEAAAVLEGEEGKIRVKRAGRSPWGIYGRHSSS